MQLGIGSYTYGWNTGETHAMTTLGMTEIGLIAAAREFDIGLIQIGDNLPLHQFTAKRLNAFTLALEQSNIQLELGAKRMTSTHLNTYIHLCERLHAPLLRFLIDDKDFRPGLKEIEKIIRSQIPLLNERNILLALENHERLKAKELVSLIENIGSESVAVCLDTVNSLGLAEGTETIVEKLAPYAVNLHLKDFTIIRLPHKMGFTVEGCPAGSGLLDIPGLLNRIKPYNRCKSAILEQWTTPELTIEETLLKERKWASASLRYLKPLFNS
jgi:sugar phosphate isomerase/epimerase